MSLNNERKGDQTNSKIYYRIVYVIGDDIDL